MILAAFFLPFILPVSVVFLIWQWMIDIQFGILQYVMPCSTAAPVPVFRRPDWFLPMVALVTIWWTNGFSILLFLAGLRDIPKDIYEAAALDGASRCQLPPHHLAADLAGDGALLTIQLILQLKIFDQVYLFSIGGRPADDHGARPVHLRAGLPDRTRAATPPPSPSCCSSSSSSFSVLQFQALRRAGER